MQSDITVPWGVTLRIEPGVEARFASHDALKSGKDSERVELRIEGKLLAQGSEAQPSLLHGAKSGYANAWYGVIIPEGGGATLSHTSLEDASTALSHESGTELSLSHAVLRHNFSGVTLQAGSATLDGSASPGSTRYAVGEGQLYAADSAAPAGAKRCFWQLTST